MTATYKDKSSFVYLDDVLDSKEPVYVRNTFSKRGAIVITLNDGTRTHREIIPNTKFPICLSNKATPAMIRNSKDLRECLDRGALSLVSKEQAEKELSDPTVREALAEAHARLSPRSAAVQKARSTNDGGDDLTSLGSEYSAKSAAPAHTTRTDVIEDAEPEDEDEEYSDVNIRVQTLVASLSNKDMKSRQVKGELMSMDLKETDLSYLIDNTTGIVQKYAKERYAELTGISPADDEDSEFSE